MIIPITLMLNLTTNIPVLASHIHNQRWPKSQDWRNTPVFPGYTFAAAWVLVSVFKAVTIFVYLFNDWSGLPPLLVPCNLLQPVAWSSCR